jgi:predicted  nucleic acid-binding Zn-ribbon protein
MSVEWFLKIKEYDSLTKMRNIHLKGIIEQQNRLSNLLERRQETLSQTEKLQLRLHDLGQNLFETEKKLKESEVQLQRMKDNYGDENKIVMQTTRTQELENEAFAILTQQENLESEKQDIKIFLQGIEKTITEIRTEVEEEISKDKAAISQLEMRLSLIFEELPNDFRELLKKTLAKNLAVGSFTRVDNGACYFCKSKLSRLEESEIDMQHLLKTCKMCHRIFLPYGT